MTTATKTEQPTHAAPGVHEDRREGVEVRVGETAAGEGSGTLRAAGVGSCVIVTLYDPKRRVGALAHALLPTSPRPRDDGASAGDAKYVDAAIDAMLEKMRAYGAKKKDLEAKIVGGANMFAAFQSNVGKDNVAAARAKLEAEGIELVGESVGGNMGRSVQFCVASGIVTAETKF